ncbi:MAG: primosomal protein N' [Phoenicibacter congonensis]|uniref:Replication restart protein PriA n=1 Tax=Phoenicibacter congonensis TaxID=1944646 RepID=A0AA43UAX5_9ACTN|nr:primosomal protein N' [Phoenicibacter congonensis]
MVVAHVVIDSQSKSLDHTFSYEVPASFQGDDPNDENVAAVGKAVLVEYGKQKCVAFIYSIERDVDPDFLDFEVKPIIDVLSESYFDESMAKLLLWLSRKFITPFFAAFRLALPADGAPRFIRHRDGTTSLKRAYRRPGNFEFCEREVAEFSNTYSRPENLTPEQKHALEVIEDLRAKENGSCVLIDGVTGSGKTEIYLQAIERVLAEGKNAIVLVPEISLTPQTVARFKSRFGNEIAVIHSKMTDTQRRQQWFWIKDGNARIVIGPRSALFAPLKKVGIVVIDEEHETTYKQESAPRYHARTVAKKMMENAGGILVLGSATPSIEALYNAKHDKNWKRVELTTRATGQLLPKVEIVDMTNLPNGGKYSLFSLVLKNAIYEEINAGHKVVLLLNQRGYSKFLICRDCGFVPKCPNCSTSLTYHESDNKLKCHYCNYAVDNPPLCPNCGSPYMKRLGTGTQRIEGELRKMFAADDCFEDVEVIRMDADTTSAEGAHEALLKKFDDANRAVLLGTQMIAKGLDFDEITLVGVINADTVMHVPDFRATERTFDLIEQVSGRSGRSTHKGRVIVQTYEPDNSALRAAQEHDRELFLRVELPKRKVLKYPPYVSIVRLLVWSHDKVAALNAANSLHSKVTGALKKEIERGVVVSPAAPCPYEKMQRSWRFHIIVKVPLNLDVNKKLGELYRKFSPGKGVSTAVDVDPLSLT